MKQILRLLTLFAIFIFLAEQLQAIPAFARKYRMSCTTCHTPAAPALKPYGDEFAGNGFRLADEQSPRYYTETGDTKLSLVRELPIAVRLEGFVNYNLAGNEKTDFASPYLLKFMSGGEISERLSYYFYFYFSERGEVAGVEDAFLMYNNLFGIDFDISLGQFQVSDPLFKRELRLSLEDYVLYTSQIGQRCDAYGGSGIRDRNYSGNRKWQWNWCSPQPGFRQRQVQKCAGQTIARHWRHANRRSFYLHR
jgi:hypothetical protein